VLEGRIDDVPRQRPVTITDAKILDYDESYTTFSQFVPLEFSSKIFATFDKPFLIEAFELVKEILLNAIWNKWLLVGLFQGNIPSNFLTLSQAKFGTNYKGYSEVKTITGYTVPCWGAGMFYNKVEDL
jgi:hypothetical protein